VIVECGFLSNYAEAEKLVSEDYQKKLAEAVTKGILQYLKDQ
jgi:N-acetylmuramoyl-L-alanine amidase